MANIRTPDQDRAGGDPQRIGAEEKASEWFLGELRVLPSQLRTKGEPGSRDVSDSTPSCGVQNQRTLPLDPLPQG